MFSETFLETICTDLPVFDRLQYANTEEEGLGD